MTTLICVPVEMAVAVTWAVQVSPTPRVKGGVQVMVCPTMMGELLPPG